MCVDVPMIACMYVDVGSISEVALTFGQTPETGGSVNDRSVAARIVRRRDRASDERWLSRWSFYCLSCSGRESASL
jgi:hypothetical protein